MRRDNIRAGRQPIVTVILFSIIAVTFSAQALAAELTMVYTGNAEGKLRFCGCPGDPYGG